MAKYLTLSGLQTFYAGLKTKLNTKVDKVDGYGLSKNDLTDELKAHYDAAYEYVTTTDAEKNVIVGVQVNGQDLTVDENRKVNVTVPTGALASKDTVAEADLAEALATKINGKVDAQDGYSLISATDLAKIGANETAIGTLNADASTEGSVDYKIAQAVASTYKVQGAKAFADLETATKTVGFVYNITDAFTTTEAFVDGAGKAYPAGTNVVWTEAGWDCLAGTYDLSGFALASQVATDISTAKGEVVGTDDDTKESDTVKGAKAFATDAASTAQSTAVSTVVGAGTDEKTADTVNGAKAFATDAVSTAKTDLIGTADDTKESDTIAGAKKYADAVVSTNIVAITDDEIAEILNS